MKKKAGLCDICGQSGTEVKSTMKAYRVKRELVVIENVPLVVCTKCGESYFTAQTLHTIERLKHEHKKVGVAQLVGVVLFV